MPSIEAVGALSALLPGFRIQFGSIRQPLLLQCSVTGWLRVVKSSLKLRGKIILKILVKIFGKYQK